MINIPVILVMLGAAALLWGFGIEPKLLKTSVYRIRQPELAGLKIVFASDFHAARGMSGGCGKSSAELPRSKRT